MDRLQTDGQNFDTTSDVPDSYFGNLVGYLQDIREHTQFEFDSVISVSTTFVNLHTSLSLQSGMLTYV